METLLHLIGLCPDHLQHLDIADFLELAKQLFVNLNLSRK